MLVKISKYYQYPNIARQTPKLNFTWKDMVFTEEDVDACDYLVILEAPAKDINISVPKENIIHICQEPPNEVSKYRQFANKKVSYTVNQFRERKGMLLSHGALPWHVNKDYNFLSNLQANNLSKENIISWVTSNQSASKGHAKRMQFLHKIKELPFVELYGRGIRPVEDKWEVLHKSKYAIAYENYNNSTYWTEKISDCFLSYAMPLYVGCKNIHQYFPKDSFIQLDPKDKHISLFLKELIASNTYEKSLEALQEARNLVLNKYQLFPFMYDLIQSIEKNKPQKTSLKEQVFLPCGEVYFNNYPYWVYIEKNLFKFKRRIAQKIK